MKLVSALVVALSLASADAAHAAVLIYNSSGPILQQQQNSPCVIGDPSCQNPTSFNWTVLDPNTSTYASIASPTYTVGQLRTAAGNTFGIGIDVNTTGPGPLATEVLDSFTLAINGTTQFSYIGPTQLSDNHNGNGFSDVSLNGIDLSTFAASDMAVFTVSYHNATDGREQFFLISSQTPPTPTPEPGALMLCVAGLMILAWRKATRST